MDTETVVRLRAASTRINPYSAAEVLDWTVPPLEADIVTLAPAEPLTSTEPVLEARNAVLSGWRLYLPHGSDVTAYDRVRVRGVDHDVVGIASDWLGSGAGLVVQVTRTEG